MSNGQSTPSLKDLFGGKLPSLSKQKITDRLKKLDDEIDSLSKAEVKEMGEKIKDGLIQNSIQGLNVSPEIIKEKGDDIEPPYILLVEGPTASYKSTLSQDLVAKYLEKTSDKGYVAAYFTLEQPYKIFLKTIRKIPFLQPLLKLREEGRFDVIDYTEHEDVFATAHKLVMKYYSGYRKYVLKKQRDELNIQKGTGVTEDIARKYPVFIKKVWAEIEEKIDEKINADNILLKFRFRKLPPNEREAFINLVAEYVRRFLLYFPFIPMVKEYLNKYKHVDEQNIDSGQVIEILKDNGVSEEGLLETVWPLDKDEPQKPTLDEDYAISILAAINRLWIKHIPEKRKIQILNELIKDKEFSKKIKARYGNAYRTALKGSDGKYDLSKVTDLMPEDFRDDLFLEESNLKLVVIDSMPMIYEQLERQLDKNTMNLTRM